MLYPLSYRGGVGRNSIVSSARVAPKAHRRTPYRTVLMRHAAKTRYEAFPLEAALFTELPGRGFE